MKRFPVPSSPAPSGGERKPEPVKDTDDEAPAYAKGGNIKVGAYAEGGTVLGRTRDFMKEPDAFRTDTGPGAKQDYGK